MEWLVSGDWSLAFRPSVPVLELIFRGAVVYFAIYMLLRLVLRREIATVSTPDLLMVVLIADAAQNAMADDYKSITDGLILVATIVSCNYLLDRTAYRFPAIGRLVHPPALPVVREGRLLPRNMRREFISKEELMTQLREQVSNTFPKSRWHL